MKLIKILALTLIFSMNLSFAQTQKEAYRNDYLYSAEYFDYLIECAEVEKQKQEELAKDNESIEISVEENVEVVNSEPEHIIFEEVENPFRLHIAKYEQLSKYGETFKKIDSKTIIPVTDNFAFFQNMSKVRNKYNSNDYKVYAGVEYTPLKFLNIASGLETNYRGLDQVPTSKKMYITPTFNLTKKLAIYFPNKFDVNSHSTDHDIGVIVSPFNSGAVDFRMYGSMTRNQTGKTSESVNFITNFYLY